MKWKHSWWSHIDIVCLDETSGSSNSDVIQSDSEIDVNDYIS